MYLPPLFAICGAPEAGKTTVQELLYRHFGVTPIDDSAPLRRAAMSLYGLTWDMVSTQSGKRTSVEVCGAISTVRELMGELGCLLEAKHGEFFFPEQAMRHIARLDPEARRCFSFASVRGRQPVFYRERGGIVLEVRSPGRDVHFHFDSFDKSVVDGVILNAPGMGDEEIIRQVEGALKYYNQRNGKEKVLAPSLSP